MCRIFVSNCGFIADGKSKRDLAEYFAYIEKQMGGDGNGIYATSVGAVVKSVNLSAPMAAGMLYQIAVNSEPSDIVVFHTRAASAGGVKSSLNHPFVIDDSTVLVHNGTWTSYNKHVPGAASDTEAVATLVEKYGKKFLLDPVLERSGVWVLVERNKKTPGGKVFVASRGGFIINFVNDGKNWALASSVAHEFFEEHKKNSVVVAPGNYLEIREVKGVYEYEFDKIERGIMTNVGGKK